ncbi:MAG: hypothetical protein AAF639_36265 [Chloroflexota bacterium]
MANEQNTSRASRRRASRNSASRKSSSKSSSGARGGSSRRSRSSSGSGNSSSSEQQRNSRRRYFRRKKKNSSESSPSRSSGGRSERSTRSRQEEPSRENGSAESSNGRIKERARRRRRDASRDRDGVERAREKRRRRRSRSKDRYDDHYGEPETVNTGVSILKAINDEYVPPKEVFIYTHVNHSAEHREHYEFRSDHFANVSRRLEDYQIDLSPLYGGEVPAEEGEIKLGGVDLSKEDGEENGENATTGLWADTNWDEPNWDDNERENVSRHRSARRKPERNEPSLRSTQSGSTLSRRERRAMRREERQPADRKTETLPNVLHGDDTIDIDINLDSIFGDEFENTLDDAFEKAFGGTWEETVDDNMTDASAPTPDLEIVGGENTMIDTGENTIDDPKISETLDEFLEQSFIESFGETEG